MIAAANLLGAMQWDPGFRGVLTVVLAVAILCGSVALILGTNSGARLGTLIAVCALSGWLAVMGTIWSIYGIGWKGQAPSWKVRDIIQGEPSGSKVAKAHDLPMPGDGVLPDPVQLRDDDKALLEEFPVDKKDPTLGELATADPNIEDSVNEKVGSWHLLTTANPYTGEAQSFVSEQLVERGVFTDATQFAFMDGFFTGGEKPRGDDDMISRVVFKVTHTFDKFHPPFLVAVQLQQVIPQTTKPGQAPPLPQRDKDATIYTVVLERDRGNLRQPAIFFTISSLIVFGVTANMLHRRDKLATSQRAAAAGAV